MRTGLTPLYPARLTGQSAAPVATLAHPEGEVRMKVRLLVDTQTPANGFVRVGDVVDVDDATCQRWVDYHIAQFANSETDEVEKDEPDEIAKDETEEVKKSPVLKKKKGK